jgi:ribonucleotide reductase alpha subunit
LPGSPPPAGRPPRPTPTAPHAAAPAQTLERSYLLRLHGKIIERPQHMLMRVAGAAAQRGGARATGGRARGGRRGRLGASLASQARSPARRRGPAARGARTKQSADHDHAAHPSYNPYKPLPPVGIHMGNIDAAVRTYHLLSERWFTHASPTLFNAGTPRPQLSSCFLVCAKGDRRGRAGAGRG